MCSSNIKWASSHLLGVLTVGRVEVSKTQWVFCDVPAACDGCGVPLTALHIGKGDCKIHSVKHWQEEAHMTLVIITGNLAQYNAAAI